MGDLSLENLQTGFLLEGDKKKKKNNQTRRGSRFWKRFVNTKLEFSSANRIFHTKIDFTKCDTQWRQVIGRHYFEIYNLLFVRINLNGPNKGTRC